MTTTVRITRTLGANSAFAAKVKAAAEPQVRRQLEELSAIAKEEFNNIVSAEFSNDRAPERRRTGRHLLGSARVVISGSTFPLQVTISSLAEGAKVASLDKGSRPHIIQGNPYLYFPAAKQGAYSPRRQAVATAQSRNKAGFRTIKAASVNHPGTAAHHFLERALERAVQRVYRQALNLGR